MRHGGDQGGSGQAKPGRGECHDDFLACRGLPRRRSGQPFAVLQASRTGVRLGNYLGPVENQGVPTTTSAVIQALKGVCHGSVEPDGRAVGEDAAILLGQIDRPRPHWRGYAAIHRGGAVDCEDRQPMARPPGVLWQVEHSFQTLPRLGIFKRFRDWVKADAFKRMFEAVPDEPDMGHAMVDATIVRVHRHGQGAKGGLKARLSASLAAV